jgi:hypothetical protein
MAGIPTTKIVITKFSKRALIAEISKSPDEENGVPTNKLTVNGEDSGGGSRLTLLLLTEAIAAPPR